VLPGCWIPLWFRGNHQAFLTTVVPLRFSLLNYRALESVLSAHPLARVRVLLVAPERANHYQYANLLSITHFDKYWKRGYDVGVELVTERTRVRRGQPGGCWVVVVVVVVMMMMMSRRKRNRGGGEGESS
jgi:hypothetical protein